MRLRPAVLAVGALLLGANGAGAQIAPALVVSDLHHRAGPTSNAPSYGVIGGGTTIEAGPCVQGWCATYLDGNAGFVSERYLDFGGPPPRAYYAPPPPPSGPAIIYAPPPAYRGYPPYDRSRDSRRW